MSPRWLYFPSSGSSCPSYNPGLYTAEEIDGLVNVDGYIPVASAAELDALRNEVNQLMGAGTCWEGFYDTGTVGKKYIQVEDISTANLWSTALDNFSGIYDGNAKKIEMPQSDSLFSNAGNGVELRYLELHTTNSSSNPNLLRDTSVLNGSINNINIYGLNTGPQIVICSKNVSGVDHRHITYYGEADAILGNDNGFLHFLNVSQATIHDIYFHQNCIIKARNKLEGFGFFTNCTIFNVENNCGNYNWDNDSGASSNWTFTSLFASVTDCIVYNCENNAVLNKGSARNPFFNAILIGVVDNSEVYNLRNNGNVESPGGSIFGLFNRILAGSTVYDCENNGSITASGINVSALARLVYGTLRDCVNNGSVYATRSSAGLVWRVENGGLAENLVNNGDYTSVNDGSGAANQNGAGLVLAVQPGGIFRRSVMNGNCTMSRQCAGLVAYNSGECYELTFNGDISAQANMGCAIYDCRDNSLSRDIRVNNLTVSAVNSAGLFRTIRNGAVVANSLFTGNISGANSFGVSRVILGTPIATAIYYDNNESSVGPGPLGSGKTTAELQTPTTNSGIYSAWTIPPWDFGTSSDYPVLTTTP